MEAVVLILIVLVCFNTVLKQTYHKPWQVIALAAVCALFVALVWQYAIEQSKSQLHDWLNNQQLMLDTAVVLSIEVVIQMAYCLLATHLMYTGKVRKRTLYIYKALRWFPGILIFPVLFHLETMLMFTLTGMDFKTIAYGHAHRRAWNHCHRERTHLRCRHLRGELDSPCGHRGTHSPFRPHRLHYLSGVPEGYGWAYPRGTAHRTRGVRVPKESE